MNRYALSLLVVAALIVSVAIAQPAAKKLEGMKPYTPTRLEWFAVELNASYSMRLQAESPYSVDYVPLVSEDAILVFVTHSPDVSRELMNKQVEHARSVIERRAKDHGWDGWIRIKERIVSFDDLK